MWKCRGHTARNKECPSLPYNRVPRDGNDSDKIDDVNSESEAKNAREGYSHDDDEDA